MKTLQLKAQLKPGKRYADGSVGILFQTAEEIGTDKFAEIDAWRQQNGWLLFKSNEFTDAEIPKDDAEVADDKPLWERQRSAMYKLFMLQGGKPQDFHTYYREQMNKIQTAIIEKIEAREGPSA